MGLYNNGGCDRENGLFQIIFWPISESFNWLVNVKYAGCCHIITLHDMVALLPVMKCETPLSRFGNNLLIR